MGRLFLIYFSILLFILTFRSENAGTYLEGNHTLLPITENTNIQDYELLSAASCIFFHEILCCTPVTIPQNDIPRMVRSYKNNFLSPAILFSDVYVVQTLSVSFPEHNPYLNKQNGSNLYFSHKLLI